MSPKSNKLTVYLIKETYRKFEEVIPGLTQPPLILDKYSSLFYQSSPVRTPEWVETFFGNKIGDSHRNQLKIAGVQCVLLVKVTHLKSQRIFALTFGQGRFMIDEGAIEERFGLKTVLNQITDAEIQNMEKRAFTRIPKLIREQLPRVGDISDFELDIERDLIESITGKASSALYGRTLTGKDAYSLTAKVDYTNLLKFLEDCLGIYSNDLYKTRFKWLDQIAQIKDPKTIDTLDQLVADAITKNNDNVWLGVPAFVDWSAHTGFKYSTRKTDTHEDTIDLTEWKKLVTTPIDIALLKSSHVTSWNGDDMAEQWTIYKCLYAEVTHNKTVYLLTDGKWYSIEKDFVKEVNQYIDNNVKWTVAPHKPYDSKFADENAYNIYLAGQLKGECLDAKNIQYGGGASKVEFCDVIASGQLYFVKKYSSSATLSHLFMQGMISGELLASDKQFRKQVRNKVLPTAKKAWVPEINPDPKKYEIIFFLIKKNLKRGKVQLPFFSKISLRRTHQRLAGYGYTVSFQVVNNKKP